MGRVTTMDQAHDLVIAEKVDRVAVLTLNQPEQGNAWSPAMQERYFDLLTDAEADPDVRAVVITGAGRTFCPGAGMDLLGELGDRRTLKAAVPVRPTTFPLGIRKPVIVAINGAAAGIGLVQALMCDVRFAAKGAKLTFTFSRRGLAAEYAASWLLPRLIGTSRAMELLVSSRVLLADEAAELGLIHRVCEPDDLLNEAMAYANDLAVNCSPSAMAMIKSQVHTDIESTLDEALARSIDLMRQAIKGPDFKEGVSSFVEKRTPDFPPLDAGTIFRIT